MQAEWKARPDRDPVSTQAARWWGLSMDQVQLSIAFWINVGFSEDKEDDPNSKLAIAGSYNLASSGNRPRYIPFPRIEEKENEQAILGFPLKSDTRIRRIMRTR